MKFKHFLEMINDIMENEINIDFLTLKIVLREFYYHLSITERERYYYEYKKVKSNRFRQQTIYETLKNNRINYYAKLLESLKKDA